MTKNQNYIHLMGEKQLFTGKLIQVVSRHFEYSRAGKIGNFRAEIAIRPPGVRGLVVRDGKILLSKELRHELKGYDYRLPGGKVFDSLEEFMPYVHADNADAARAAVKKELLEEVGIVAHKVKDLHVSLCGASVQWTLFYYEISEFGHAPDGQQLENGEVIFPEWKTFEEVKQLCLQGGISEDRTVAVLLRYLATIS
jgi:ADP-ribose pyrophosphatase